MNQSYLSILLSLALPVAACAPSRPPLKGDTELKKLNSFYEWSYNKYLDRYPEYLTWYGIDRKQDELSNRSKAYEEETQTMLKEHLKILKSFDRSELKADDQLNYDVFKAHLETKIEEINWSDHIYVVNQMFGVQTELADLMMNLHKVKKEKDLQNYIARLNQFRTTLAEVVNQLMRSENIGVLPPKFVFPLVLSDSKNIISGKPFDNSKEDSPLYDDFKKKLKSLKLSKEKNKKYEEKGRKALLNSVKPGYEQLIAFLKKQEKRATKDHGVWKFPKGKEFYKVRLRQMTTTDLSPKEIHENGLENVKRIHKEMNTIRKQVGFKGDLKAFFQYMKTSPKFFYSNNKSGKQKYLKKAKSLIDNMRKDLDRFFITKPEAAIEVRPVEPYREKSAGLAFYQSPNLDGTRPGAYYVNLYNMKAVPTWEAEALAYHEGIPGHHMQLSIALEMDKQPLFRRTSHYTAYIEGWGLYSEKFPKEYGYYKDPYSDFGRLSMELTRACRLVVDTGLHWKKWTREEAIKYLDDNLPSDHDDNVRQINRYIVMPGQATAYMTGMLKILDLRGKAIKALGQKFDIRKFHDVILTSGSIPLDILERQVDRYIQKEKPKPVKKTANL